MFPSPESILSKGCGSLSFPVSPLFFFLSEITRRLVSYEIFPQYREALCNVDEQAVEALPDDIRRKAFPKQSTVHVSEMPNGRSSPDLKYILVLCSSAQKQLVKFSQDQTCSTCLLSLLLFCSADRTKAVQLLAVCLDESTCICQ